MGLVRGLVAPRLQRLQGLQAQPGVGVGGEAEQEVPGRIPGQAGRGAHQADAGGAVQPGVGQGLGYLGQGARPQGGQGPHRLGPGLAPAQAGDDPEGQAGVAQAFGRGQGRAAHPGAFVVQERGQGPVVSGLADLAQDLGRGRAVGLVPGGLQGHEPGARGQHPFDAAVADERHHGPLGHGAVRVVQVDQEPLQGVGLGQGAVGLEGQGRGGRVRGTAHQAAHRGQGVGRPEGLDAGQGVAHHLGRGVNQEPGQGLAQGVGIAAGQDVHGRERLARLVAGQAPGDEGQALAVLHRAVAPGQAAGAQGGQEHPAVAPPHPGDARQPDQEHAQQHVGDVHRAQGEDRAPGQAQEQAGHRGHGHGLGQALHRGLHRQAAGRGQGLVEDHEGRPVEAGADHVVQELEAHRQPEHQGAGRGGPGGRGRHPHAGQDQGHGQEHQGVDRTHAGDDAAGGHGAQKQHHRRGQGVEPAEEPGHALGPGRVGLGLGVQDEVGEEEAGDADGPEQVDARHVAVRKGHPELGPGPVGGGALLFPGRAQGAARPAHGCGAGQGRAHEGHGQPQQVRRAQEPGQGRGGQAGQADRQELARAHEPEQAFGLGQVEHRVGQAPEGQAREDVGHVEPDGQHQGRPARGVLGQPQAQAGQAGGEQGQGARGQDLGGEAALEQGEGQPHDHRAQGHAHIDVGEVAGGVGGQEHRPGGGVEDEQRRALAEGGGQSPGQGAALAGAQVPEVRQGGVHGDAFQVRRMRPSDMATWAPSGGKVKRLLAGGGPGAALSG